MSGCLFLTKIILFVFRLLQVFLVAGFLGVLDGFCVIV